MLLCMRTTIDIDDDLFLELKRVAAEKRQSLKALIEDAIRSSLSRRYTATRGTENQAVITFRGNGVRSGVNLDSMSELLDVMDGTP
jgi:metal-responsive CopG/Arc/MetJ family transcriptional regulator